MELHEGWYEQKHEHESHRPIPYPPSHDPAVIILIRVLMLMVRTMVVGVIVTRVAALPIPRGITTPAVMAMLLIRLKIEDDAQTHTIFMKSVL